MISRGARPLSPDSSGLLSCSLGSPTLSSRRPPPAPGLCPPPGPIGVGARGADASHLPVPRIKLVLAHACRKPAGLGGPHVCLFPPRSCRVTGWRDLKPSPRCLSLSTIRTTSRARGDCTSARQRAGMRGASPPLSDPWAVRVGPQQRQVGQSLGEQAGRGRSSLGSAPLKRGAEFRRVLGCSASLGPEFALHPLGNGLPAQDQLGLTRVAGAVPAAWISCALPRIPCSGSLGCFLPAPRHWGGGHSMSPGESGAQSHGLQHLWC